MHNLDETSQKRIFLDGISAVAKKIFQILEYMRISLAGKGFFRNTPMYL
jgi:hypothetical protein